MKVRREIAYTWACLGVVAVSLVMFFCTLPASESLQQSIEKSAFIVAVVLLVWGNFVYHLARLGYLWRYGLRDSAAPDRVNSNQNDKPQLGILIPSYREEEGVLLQTILSVALMRHPHRQVVVLLDDPPNVTGKELAVLQSARALVTQVDESFKLYAERLAKQRRRFDERRRSADFDASSETPKIARLYDQLAEWLEAWAVRVIATTPSASSHTSEWFIKNILQKLADEYHLHASKLRSSALGADAIDHEYRNAISLVRLRIESFERKLFVNLSHQPNKAMNLNSYIGLIGGHFQEVVQPDGLHLIRCDSTEATLSVPEFDFVLTIDADSAVLPNYASTLLPLMQEDQRIAVAQTPYSAFAGAPGALERIAGATTDIQFLIHQGFTKFEATYWVGANAILRVSALREIQQFSTERGYQVPVFIQDRTVIEDTGSTIDLIRRGWRLYNHPERLAYSATPPDYGSLIIQRRRWSNGGLLILPDLLQHLWKAGRFFRCIPEAVMRAHYLCSPAIGGFCVLFLMLYRFDDGLMNVWLPLSALPYYWLYARDLRFAGYTGPDVFRVYALNLLLMPVNLAGVGRSLQQLITGKKSSFGRTPKVETRTLTPLFYILFHGLLLGYLVAVCALDIQEGYHSHAVFAFLTFLFCFYGITRFLGWRESFADLAQYLPDMVRFSRLQFPALQASTPRNRVQAEASEAVMSLPSSDRAPVRRQIGS